MTHARHPRTMAVTKTEAAKNAKMGPFLLWPLPLSVSSAGGSMAASFKTEGCCTVWQNDSFPSFLSYPLSTGFPRLSASRVAEAVGALQTCAPSSSARSELTAATFRIRNTTATDDNIAWLSGMALRNLSTVFLRLFRFCLLVPSVKRARVLPRSNTDV